MAFIMCRFLIIFHFNLYLNLKFFSILVLHHNILFILLGSLICLPYEFKRPILDSQVGKLMKIIQEADRNAKFSIGGIAQHVIEYVKTSRKDARRKRRLERVGVIAQRYQKSQPAI